MASDVNIKFWYIFFAKIVISWKKILISRKNSVHVFWTNIDLSYHFGILRMSTFQEIIQFFNDTHVRNAIHENVCLIFYGTDLIVKKILMCMEFSQTSLMFIWVNTCLCGLKMPPLFFRHFDEIFLLPTSSNWPQKTFHCLVSHSKLNLPKMFQKQYIIVLQHYLLHPRLDLVNLDLVKYSI